MPLQTRQSAPASADDVIRLPGAFPPIPEIIRRRFSAEGERWDQDISRWWRTTVNAFNDFGRSNADATNGVVATQGDIVVRMDGFTVALTEERTARINADEAIGRWIVTVSAIASSSQNISVQSTPPGSPSLNDLWVDNTDLSNPITYYWSGSAWVEQSDFVLAAAVAEERTARVTADGFLEGKYTLTVTAGDVVTGMNITSSTGTGTNISSVIFRATDFKIHNGVTGVTMFTVSGSNVNLANVLTVSTSGKVFTGTGSWGNSNTPFYVDSTLFSLGANLTWNSATSSLVITGSITATTGTIGGWTIGATSLTGGNATLSSTGVLTLGTSNDVVILSAVDATYRLWVGNATAGSATFRVTKAGAVTATSGAIGGWTLATTTLSANNAVLDSAGQLVLGTSNDVIILSATDATYRMWAGNATAGSASFSVTKTGLLSAVGASISGTITSSIVIVGHTAQYTDSTTSNFQVINTSGNTNAVQNFCFGSGTPNFEGWVAGGTIGSPSQTTSGRTMKLKLVTYGSGGGGWLNGGNASIWLVATEAHTNTARGTEIRFRTTANGTITEGYGLVIGNDSRLYIGPDSGLAMDTNLYRASANVLKTDDAFQANSLATSTFESLGSSNDDVGVNHRVMVAGSPVIVLNKDLPGVTISGSQIIGTRKTGWSAATGTATRTSFDTATVTTEQLAQRVKAWIDDAISHGLIGA